MTDAPQSQPIPLAAISPSATNPRRVFRDLDGLGASINAVGVLQPILIRPWPAGRDPCLRAADSDVKVAYEIVCGERRWRACAEFTQLDTIPAIVRDLTDDEAADVRLVENDQRDDILPSERAAGYRDRIAAGRTADQIAATVGKSVWHVRRALALLDCPEDLLGAVDAGTVPPTVAEQVAQVPDPRQRDTAARCVIAGVGDPRDLSSRPPGGGAGEWSVLSVRETKELIATHFQRELKGAPFKLADKKLLPQAGSCAECPKRVGNAKHKRPGVFDGTRDDVCLDPRCYRWKVEEHEKQLHQRAEERAGKKAAAAGGPGEGGGKVPLPVVAEVADPSPDPDADALAGQPPEWKKAADALNAEAGPVCQRDPAAALAAKEVGYAASRACLDYATNPTVLAQARLDAVCAAVGLEWAALLKKHSPPAPPAEATPAPAPKRSAPKKPARGGGADERPYAFTVTAARGGNRRQFDVVAPTANTARGRASLKLARGEKIVSLDPMTRAAYERVHRAGAGGGGSKGGKRKAEKAGSGV